MQRGELKVFLERVYPMLLERILMEPEKYGRVFNFCNEVFRDYLDYLVLCVLTMISTADSFSSMVDLDVSFTEALDMLLNGCVGLTRKFVSDLNRRMIEKYGLQRVER